MLQSNECYIFYLHAAEKSKQHDKIILTTLAWYVEETINNSLLYKRTKNNVKDSRIYLLCT